MIVNPLFDLYEAQDEETLQPKTPGPVVIQWRASP